jgi:hypothetical protein
MYKIFEWLKKLALAVVFCVVLPLYLFANAQSLVDFSERNGASTINLGALGSIAGSNALVMWWKILGVLPTRSLLPTMGQNFVTIGDLRQKYKWGGCSLIFSPFKEQRAFIFAKGFARCDGVSGTLINSSFADLSEDQQALLQEVKFLLPPGEYGPRDYEEVAYALMTNMDAVGLEASKRVMDKECAKAYLGVQASRVNCFAILELSQVLEEVFPSNEQQRRAIAVKAGGAAWFWGLADANLGSLQMGSLNRAALVAKKGSGNNGSYSNISARAGQWRSQYIAALGSKDRFSLMALSRVWKSGELDDLNQFLRNRKKRPIAKEIWDEALAGR